MQGCAGFPSRGIAFGQGTCAIYKTLLRRLIFCSKKLKWEESEGYWAAVKEQSTRKVIPCEDCMPRFALYHWSKSEEKAVFTPKQQKLGQK